MSEPTATNPQTGEKIVFRGGQWVPMGAAPAAPAPQTAPAAGPVYGAAPRPEAPPAPPSGYTGGPGGLTPIPGGPADPTAPQNQPRPAPPSGYRFKADGSLEAIPGGPEDSAIADPSEGIGKLTRVIEQLDNIYADSGDNGGWFETGTFGATTRAIPGTASYDLGGAIQTIDANMAFDALQRMRDASPTGGALGQVTEKELALLRSTIANLDPNQSQDQFIRSLGIAKGAYLDMLRRLDPAKAEEIERRGTPRYDESGAITYDERGAAAVGGATPPADGGGGGGGGYLQALGEGTSSLIKGVAALPGMVINPVGQAMYGALGYDQEYNAGQIISDALGLPSNPNATNDTIIQGAAAAMTGGLGARAASTIANPGVAQNVLATIGRTPIRDTVAGAGAGAGSVAGRASGVPGGEIGGALLGGLGGYGGASGVNAMLGMARGGEVSALGQAAARQGVDLLPADAGGATARAVTTGTRASPLSVAPVVSAAQRQQGQMRNATQRAAESQGEIVTTEQAGQSVRNAAERFTRQTSQRASRLYDRAQQAAQGVLIKPLQTVAKLEEQIARLQNDPSAPAGLVDELVSFRDKIAGGVNVTGLRDARTRLSQGVYDGKLRSSSDQAMWRGILGDLSSDIDLGLRNAGRGDAAGMFKQADTFWQQRVEHIDQVLQPILGRDRSGEQIITAVENMARGQSGGNARLSRLLGEMTPEEAGQVRAVIIDRIGRANPGAQNAEGTAFSASTFLTNWNKLTPQAKGSLFSEKGLRSDLDDLARLADGMKTSQSMANHSNTGVAIGANSALGTMAFMAHPVLALVGASAQFLTGKLMASPGFARLLTRTAKMPPEAAGRVLSEQVGVLAAREPLIANDARAVQQWLAESFAQSPSRAAANEQENN